MFTKIWKYGDSVFGTEVAGELKQSNPLNVIGTIRIHHVCEGGLEKSIPRITDWHHEACRVMTNGDHEGWIFLSHPHTNNGFFFLLTTKYLILYWKKKH